MAAKGALHHYYDSYVVERFVTIHKGLRVPSGKDLVVGQGATVVGSIRGGGSVFLGKSVIVRGAVRATGDVVVGSLAKVEGSVEAGGDAMVLEGAHVVGDVRAGRGARVIGARVGGRILAKGDVEVRGEASTRRVEAGGRVRSLPAPEPLP